jgi:hypothetical protein
LASLIEASSSTGGSISEGETQPVTDIRCYSFLGCEHLSIEKSPKSKFLCL